MDPISLLILFGFGKVLHYVLSDEKKEACDEPVGSVVQDLPPAPQRVSEQEVRADLANTMTDVAGYVREGREVPEELARRQERLRRQLNVLLHATN